MAKQIKSYAALSEYYSEVEAYIPRPPEFKAGDVAQIKSHDMEWILKHFRDGDRVTVLSRKYHGGHADWGYTVISDDGQTVDLWGVFLERFANG